MGIPDRQGMRLPPGAGRRKDKEVISKVREIVEEAETCRNAYFWTPGSSAGSRRWNEKKHSKPCVEWQENGHSYSAEYCYEESCRNVYAWGVYYRDGKKTTLTAIRNSLKRMEAEAC